MPTPAFEKFVRNPHKGTLITLDPGETTGWAVWDHNKLKGTGQLDTKTVQSSILMLDKWLDTKSDWDRIDMSDRHLYPCYVVMEEYRVYSHLAQSHSHSTIHTARLIGAIEALLTLKGIRYEMCPAGLAKGFATDQKLEDWGMYQVGQRHARDAIRHGVYFLCCRDGKNPVT